MALDPYPYYWLRARGKIYPIGHWQEMPYGRVFYKLYNFVIKRNYKQQSYRAKFHDAVVAWQALTAAEKDVYNKRDYPYSMSGYNRFIREYLNTQPTMIIYWKDLPKSATDPVLLTASEAFAKGQIIDDLITASGGLIALILMDATTATTALEDKGPNNLDAELSGNASGLSPAMGGLCPSLLFSDNHYFKFVDNDLWSFNGGSPDKPFTIVALIKPSSVTTSTILGKHSLQTGATKNEWRFRFADNNKLYIDCYDNSVGATCRIGRYYNLDMSGYIDQWMVVAATYSGSGTNAGFKIYINGVRVDDTNDSGLAYVGMENLAQEPASYTRDADAIIINQFEGRYGLLWVDGLEHTAVTIASISRKLLAYAGTFL